jgi:hypothetical protein
MADVGILEGEKLLVKVDINGDGNFVHPCLINTTRSIQFTTNVTETEVADCSNQSLPAKIVRKAKSIDFTVSGAGKLDKTSLYPYLLWWKSAVAKNVEIVQDVTGAEGGWTISVPMILKDLTDKGERGDYQDVDLTLVPAGALTLAQNA